MQRSWEQGGERQRDIAAHRKSADHRAFDAEPIEQCFDVLCMIVHRHGMRHVLGVPEAAQVGRDHPCDIAQTFELGLPQRVVMREAMYQHQWLAYALFCVVHRHGTR